MSAIYENAVDSLQISMEFFLSRMTFKAPALSGAFCFVVIRLGIAAISVPDLPWFQELGTQLQCLDSRNPRRLLH